MSKSKKKLKHSKTIWLIILGFILLGILMAALMRGNDIILINPRGTVAEEQKNLLVVSTLIMLVVAVPTLLLFYFFAWRYRETSKKAVVNYHPKNKKSTAFMLWVIPIVLVIILASQMIPATSKLEPQKSLAASGEPLTVQVVALRWKWLFIYPEQNIASINFVHLPVNKPVKFELTADETPMSSFWIPHLGGQLYAMTEHVNRLNLMADTTGDYPGSAAEINGSGFAGTKFITRVSTQENFDLWVREAKLTNDVLDFREYNKLLKPSENHKVVLYRETEDELFNKVVKKYAGSHSHYNRDNHNNHEVH